MNRKKTIHLLKMILLAGILISCAREKSDQVYYPLKNDTWQRFNILKFELPVNEGNQRLDVLFFAELTQAYPFDNLDFNMVMNTPSGEERINSFQIKVNSGSGGPSGNCRGDTCLYELPLQKALFIAKPGVLTIEIENLNPRIETVGISGVGIRLIPSGD
jgi:gliding motility-associated lipoprotein GldH